MSVAAARTHGADRTRWSIGVDMGGTFIDEVAAGSDGRLLSLKHPRVAGQLAAPVLAGIDRLCAEHGIAPAEVARIVHGSTVVTNLLLEQNAPPIAVVTTAGMRDVLALARQDRRALYAPVIAPAVPESALFPARLRFEIGGRIDAQGSETAPLDLSGIDAIAQAIADAGVRAISVCLLFAHRNAAHELHVADAMRARLPEVFISRSSEVDPKPREFERFLTTALDAYCKPMVSDYLRELAAALTARGLPEPFLMRSEGGTGAWRDVAARPVSLAMSGPCAALQGVAASLQGQPGLPSSLLAIDVGGTSTDIGLVEDGRPAFAETLQCGDLSLRLRCADVDSLSVGGGSVVQVLAGGALRLGPHSQGAWPGPAAYGLGGDRATLTDALCLLGRLPARLAGGVALDRDAAEAAIVRDVAAPLGIAVEDAAASVVRTAAAAMAEALKMRSFQRGLDPSDALLVAAGGGGAQHAAEVAELAGITLVRVLPQAGVIAALGMLCALPTRTLERSCEWAFDDAGLQRAEQLATELVPADAAATVRWDLALGNAGQEFPIDVSWQPGVDTVEVLQQRFDARHTQLRGAAPGGHAVQVRLMRAVIEQPLPRPAPLDGIDADAAAHTAAPGTALAAVSAWDGLPSSGHGPQALFAAMTTVWVPAGWQWLRLDDDSLSLTPLNAVGEDKA